MAVQLCADLSQCVGDVRFDHVSHVEIHLCALNLRQELGHFFLVVPLKENGFFLQGTELLVQFEACQPAVLNVLFHRSSGSLQLFPVSRLILQPATQVLDVFFQVFVLKDCAGFLPGQLLQDAPQVTQLTLIVLPDRCAPGLALPQRSRLRLQVAVVHLQVAHLVNVTGKAVVKSLQDFFLGPPRHVAVEGVQAVDGGWLAVGEAAALGVEAAGGHRGGPSLAVRARAREVVVNSVTHVGQAGGQLTAEGGERWLFIGGRESH